MFLRNRELKRYIEIFTGKGGLPTGRIFFLAIRTPFKTSFMVSRRLYLDNEQLYPIQKE